MAAQDINTLIRQIEVLKRTYSQLTSHPAALFNVTSIDEAEAAIRTLQDAIDEATDRATNLGNSFRSIQVEIQNIVGELQQSNNAQNLFTKALKGTQDLTQKLKYDQLGISELNKKELLNIQSKLQAQKEEVTTQAKILAQEKGILDIDALTATQLSTYSEEEQSILRGLQDRFKIYNEINVLLDKRLKKEQDFNTALGLTGTLADGLKGVMDKIGFGKLGDILGMDSALEKAKEKAKVIAHNKELSLEKELQLGRDIQNQNTGGLSAAQLKAGFGGIALKNKQIELENLKQSNQEQIGFNDKLKVASTFFKELGTNAIKNITDPLLVGKFLLDQIVDALKSADNATGELAKSFGTSYNEAANIRNELGEIANLSGDVNINIASLQKSLVAINKEFGTASTLNGELLKDFTHLTEVAGYTNEAALGLSRITLATGTDLSENTSEILGQAGAFNATNKLALNEKEIVEAVSKVSAATTLSLGMQPEALSKAVLQAKAFGLEMSQVEQIASSLLQFESSISNEIEAELLTGKQLNLEQARYYALTNNVAGVAEEIAKQVGTAADFTKMNVISQEALAKSVGMSREDLAKSLIEREALQKIGEKDADSAKKKFDSLVAQYGYETAIKELGDEKYGQQLASQSIQERFNKSIEKLKDIFISLAEPILQIVSPLVDLITSVLPAINQLLNPFIQSLRFIASYGREILGIFIAYKGVQLGINIAKGAETAMLAEQIILDQGKMSFNKLSLLLEKESLGVKITAYTLGVKDFIIEKGKAAWKFLQIGYEATINALKTIGSFLSRSTLMVDIGRAAMGAISSLSSIPFIGWALGLAAAATTVALGYKFLKGNDVVSQGQGYGKRTLMGPEGAIALNDKDTVVAGTDLFGGGKEKSTNTKESISSNISINFNPLIIEIQQLRTDMNTILSQILNKEGDVYLDGNKVGKSLALGSSKIG